jgi:hypothetical protein
MALASLLFIMDPALTPMPILAFTNFTPSKLNANPDVA